jgi:hypothetical protein
MQPRFTPHSAPESAPPSPARDAAAPPLDLGAPGADGSSRTPDVALRRGASYHEPAGLVSSELLLAADRPDHLVLVLRDAAPYLLGAGDDDGLPEPGERLDLRFPPALELRTVVERREVQADAGARTVSIVASAPYHERRETFAERRFYGVRPGEIARHVALELGLAYRVDDGGERVGEFHLEGDPLAGLRRLARRCGFGFAVARGVLFFVRDLAGVGSTHRLGGGAGIGASVKRITHRCRSATVHLAFPGRQPVPPLDRLELDGFGAPFDGWYRTLRCGVRCDASEELTELLLGEERHDSVLYLNEFQDKDPDR